jgi:hypothetical protein
MIQPVNDLLIRTSVRKAIAARAAYAPVCMNFDVPIEERDKLAGATMRAEHALLELVLRVYGGNP